MEEKKNNQGFKIVCLDCGYEDCTIESNWDYDSEDNLFNWGNYIYCPNCSQNDR